MSKFDNKNAFAFIAFVTLGLPLAALGEPEVESTLVQPAPVAALTQSQTGTVMALDWRERQDPSANLKAHDETLLGDSIDLQSGRLSFEQVDVSLPGNFSLPVEMRRRLNPSQMQSGEFLDWQIAIPTISTKILDDEWYATNPTKKWGKVRCSGTLASAIPNASWPTLSWALENSTVYHYVITVPMDGACRFLSGC